MNFTDSNGVIVPLPAGASIEWRVSGYALLRDGGGRYLMVQSGNGKWHFPGGGIEQAETIANGVVRELREETGYILDTSSQVLFTFREQYFYHSDEEKFYHSLQLFFTASLAVDEPDEKQMTAHDKNRTRAWIRLEELPANVIHPSVVEVINKLRLV